MWEDTQATELKQNTCPPYYLYYKLHNSLNNNSRDPILPEKKYGTRARILVQATIYCRLLIGGDGHLDQSEAYDIS